MFQPDQYSLIDFGHGRRLERFGEFILDRPCPAAENCRPANPEGWSQANARFERTGSDRGVWSHRTELPGDWSIQHENMAMEIKPTQFGHIGVFPEQASNWDWIERCVSSAGRSINVLNLFAYTGGSTLAALRAGARVTHVDGARNIVAWARRNADANRLAVAPVRWIVEDVMKFVAREVRRGARYDAVILDPPSYGHGAGGEVWRLAKDLPLLLQRCAELTRDARQFMLLTCHTPGFTHERLSVLVDAALGSRPSGFVEASELAICSRDGRSLPGGSVVRWKNSP